MYYQKVNQNWRKSKLLLSPRESRFSQPHTVTWTLRPPANSSPHSTSLQPPPMGTGAVKCTSLNLNFTLELESSSHIMSFLIQKSESFQHLELFFKIYHSLKNLETTVLTLYTPGGFFYQGHLYQIDSSNPRSFYHGMDTFQGKVDFKVEKLCLAHELVFWFFF